MSRIETPFTAEHFVQFCESMIGQPYWYGTTVSRCTKDKLTSKAKQYPSHYGADRMARYNQDIAAKKVCADCVGGVKGYMWTGGGQGVREAIGTGKSFASSYESNGCPDKSANGMFDWAKSKGAKWGTIDTLPEVPGLALRLDGHVGYYIGNGYAVEWRGFAYGCVKTKVASRNWTHWYELPFIDYAEQEKPSTDGRTVVVTGDSVNVRAGDSTDYQRLDTAHKGDTFPLVAVADNGWRAIRYKLPSGDAVCWIGPTYTKVV